jgi:UDP-N-acetylglucosamine--dolichyl-phosphate N-acetylglucosaminephosphotransferase
MDVDICSGCLLYPTIFILGWKISERAISSAKQSFIDAGLKGNDMGRADRPLVPESLGLISAVVFLVLAGTVTVLNYVKKAVVVVQIPFLDSNVDLVLFLGALLTITSAAFLGFVDDVLNLRWRHKLWAPGLFSIYM